MEGQHLMTKAHWQQRKVLVTGATGLVGAWLVKRLCTLKAHVVVLIRDMDPQSELLRSHTLEKTTVVNGKLEEYETLERAINEHDIDTVFHLGAQTIVGAAEKCPLATFEANIRGTYHLLEACRRQGPQVKSILIASSDKAYGTSPQLPYTEDMPLVGTHPYEVSKSCADLIATAYYQSYKLPVAIARCGNIYGGGDLNWSRLIPSAIRALREGKAPVIRSDGTYLRDYVYVQDAVDAYMTLAEHLHEGNIQGQAFNFGPEKPLTVLQVVNTIATMMGHPDITPIITNTAQGEIHSQYLSYEKARKMLEWHPQYSLQEGLKETIAWYQDFLSTTAHE